MRLVDPSVHLTSQLGFPQPMPHSFQFVVKFMAENQKKKQQYLETRFPEARIFTDVADLKSMRAKTSDGGSAEVPEAG